MINEPQFYRLSIPSYAPQRIEIIKFNVTQLQEVNSSKYPNLTRILDARKGAKRRRLTQILEYLLNPEEFSFIADPEEDRRIYTDIPVAELVGRYGGGRQTYVSVFNLLCVCGLAVKHNPNVYDEEHTTFIDEEAQIHAARQRGRHDITRRKYFSARVYYHFPRWTEEVLQTAEERASSNVSTLTTVIDTYGEEQAQALLDTDRSIPNDTRRARERIDKYVAQALSQKGYTTKNQIMKAVHLLTTREITRRRKIKEGKRIKPYEGRKTVDLEPILRKYIPEMCRLYGLTYKQPTKEEISKYNLKDRKWIIAYPPERSDGVTNTLHEPDRISEATDTGRPPVKGEA